MPDSPDENVAVQTGVFSSLLECLVSEAEPQTPSSSVEVIEAGKRLQGILSRNSAGFKAEAWDEISIEPPVQQRSLRLWWLQNTNPALGRFIAVLNLARAEGSLPLAFIPVMSSWFLEATNSPAQSSIEDVGRHLKNFLADLGIQVIEGYFDRNLLQCAEQRIENGSDDDSLESEFEHLETITSSRMSALSCMQREFAKYKLLSKERERRLAERMDLILIRITGAFLENISFQRLLIATDLWSLFEDSPATYLKRTHPYSNVICDIDSGNDDWLETTDVPDGLSNEDDDDGIPGDDDSSALELLKHLKLFLDDEIEHKKVRALFETGWVLNRDFWIKVSGCRQALDENFLTFITAEVCELDKIRDVFTSANLRLAYSMAMRYSWAQCDMEDLAQEANWGLLKAVDKYESVRGYKFSTYATWWVRQSVSRFIMDNERTIRVPVHVMEDFNRFQRAIDYYSDGEKVDCSKLASALGLTDKRLQTLKELTLEPLPIETIHEDLSGLWPYGFDEYSSDPEPDRIVELEQLADGIRSVLATLTEQQSRILKMRFGVGGGDGMTLEQVGSEMALTRERIRQIETKAFSALRALAKKQALGELQ